MKTILQTVSFLSAFLLFTFHLVAQKTVNWRDMNGNKDADFYQVQQDFNQYWQGRAAQKGSGYKVFKRWENFMAPRVYPSGNMLLPSTNYQNYVQWLAEKSFSGASLMPANWISLGPNSIPTGYDVASGRIDFVRFDPTNSNTMYVGAPDGGLWKSTDAGTTWTTNTDFLTIIGCSDIAIDPANTQIMYLATGNWEFDRRSIGILKTTDGGATWNTTSLTWTAIDNYKIRKLVMHPNNSSIMMAVTDGGIFRTTDGWATNSNVYCCNTLYDIEFKPGDPTIMYAAGQDFWKSTDTGATWSPVTTGLPAASSVSRIVLGVSPANAAYVYALIGDTNHGYLGTYRSTDSGNSFSLQSSTPNILDASKDGSGTGGQAGHDLAIAVSPTNAEVVTIGGISSWQSVNGGIDWTIIAFWYGTDDDYPGQGDGPPDYVHADIQDIQYSPGSNSTLFATCDGGIYKSVDNGANWTKLSGNLSVAQQTSIALSASSPTILACGEQDIGTVKLNGGTWSGINGGDGEDAFIDRTNNLNIVSSNPNGSHAISRDGGLSHEDITGLPGGQWFSPISQDPVTATTVYAGGRPALYRSLDLLTNPTYSWTMLGTPTGTGNILRFVVSPSNADIIYTIKENAVSKSTNAGTSWADITGTLPVGNAQLANIAISGTDPDKVWVTFSGYSAGDKVFKTTNGGTSWTNLSADLPNLPINTIVSVNSSPDDAVYIGTDISIFYTDNTSGGSWALFNTGLPNVAVTDLEIYYPTLKIRASTYGRGAWESDLNPVACFSNLLVSNTPIPTGIYKSGGEITSHTSMVANGTNVIFKSDTGILLNPIFEVLVGGVFEAIIEACMGGN